MPDRDAYLRELEELLPMPAEQRLEILEEIASHLDDAVTAATERGAPFDRAEGDAQARLGSPSQLARELARPEQSAWRLLAAAGSGVQSLIGNWLYGYLVGSLGIFIVVIGVAAVLQIASGVLGARSSLGTTDQGWNTVFVAGAVATGLFYAGRATVQSVSRSSRRLLADVRPWVTGTIAVLSAILLVFVVEMPHNAVSVAAFALAPLAVVLGAYRPGMLPKRVRLSYAFIAIVVFALIVIGIGSAATVTTESSEPRVIDRLPDRGLSMIGPVVADPPDGPGIVQSNGWGSYGDAVLWDADVVSASDLAAFTDLRLEAWHTDEATFDISTNQSGPFAVAPVKQVDGTLHAEIETNRDPEGGFWDLVLTGVGRDGSRYVLAAGSGGNSTFEGSAFDWLVAVLK